MRLGRPEGEVELAAGQDALAPAERGVEGLAPRVDSLGGPAWQRVKRKVKADLRDMAKDLLQLYAARAGARGHAFAPD